MSISNIETGRVPLGLTSPCPSASDDIIAFVAMLDVPENAWFLTHQEEQHAPHVCLP